MAAKIQVQVVQTVESSVQGLDVELGPVKCTYTPDDTPTYLSTLSPIPTVLLSSTQPPSYESHVRDAAMPAVSLRDPPEYGTRRAVGSERLFWLGFLFFPLWLVGASYVYVRSNAIKSAAPRQGRSHVSSLNPAALESGYGEEINNSIRTQERFWALLCLRAFLTFSLIVGIAVAIMVYTKVF